MRVPHEHLRETHNIGNDTPERIILPEVSPLMTTLNIELAGVSDAGEGFSIVRLRPHFGHVLACWGGRGKVLIDQEWNDCGAGSAYLTPPRQLHAYRTIPGERWAFAWILWHPSPGGTPPLVDCDRPTLVGADPEYLRSAILGLYRESIGPAQPTVLDRWVELVHAYGARIGSAARRKRHDLSAVWERVDMRLAYPWTAASLAEFAGTSSETLRRLCQRETGHSPMHHVTKLRMRRAAMLLESTELKVESVADAVGYTSAFAFSTAFKRHMGKSPADYRTSRRNARRRRNAVLARQDGRVRRPS